MKLHNSHAPTGYGFYDSVGSAAPFRRTPNEPHLASIHNIFSLNEAKLLRHCCLHLNVAVDVNGDCEMVAGNSALEWSITKRMHLAALCTIFPLPHLPTRTKSSFHSFEIKIKTSYKFKILFRVRVTYTCHLSRFCAADNFVKVIFEYMITWYDEKMQYLPTVGRSQISNVQCIEYSLILFYSKTGFISFGHRYQLLIMADN